MTFDDTILVAGRELDRVIADDLARLARRVRRDLVATSRPDDPPSPARIERNVTAVLRYERKRLRAWRAQILPLYALDRHTLTTRPC